jgi:hypothetical protein
MGVRIIVALEKTLISPIVKDGRTSRWSHNRHARNQLPQNLNKIKKWKCTILVQQAGSTVFS